MILAIKYTNKTNPQDIQSSTYTSLAHKEYHEGQHPYLVSQYDQENVTQAEVQKIIIKQGLSNMAYGAELIAELRAYNLSAFLTGALTSQQFFTLKQKLAVVKDHIEDGSIDFAMQALQAADITEMPDELKAEFVAKMQTKIDTNNLELNPVDAEDYDALLNPPVEPVVEPAPEEPNPEPMP